MISDKKRKRSIFLFSSVGVLYIICFFILFFVFQSVSLAETSRWGFGAVQKRREKDKSSDGEYIQGDEWWISS